VNANNGRQRYTVKLTVSTANGCSSIAERKNYIIVGDKPPGKLTGLQTYGALVLRLDISTMAVRPSILSTGFLWVRGRSHYPRCQPESHLDYTYDADPATYVPGLVVWNGAVPTLPGIVSIPRLIPGLRSWLLVPVPPGRSTTVIRAVSISVTSRWVPILALGFRQCRCDQSVSERCGYSKFSSQCRTQCRP
jgi:hypothetical protein